MCRSFVQAVIENGNKLPQKLAIGFSKRKVTYKELSVAIRKISFILKTKYAIKKDDKVIISASSTPEYISVFLAIQYLGAVTVPIDKNEKETSVTKLLRFIKPKLLISDFINLPEVVSIKRLCENIFSENDEECCSLNEPVEQSDDSLIEMIFTTGTTSEPKCAMHTVKSINAIIQNTARGTEMTENDVILNPLPLNHSAGLRVLRAALFIGATVVLQAGFTFAKTLENNITEYSCTRLVCVPASVELLRKQMQSKFDEILGKLKYLEIAAGMLPPKLRKELSNLFSNTIIINTWGSTETGGAIFWTNRMLDKIDSLGKPAEGILIKTINSDGVEIKAENIDTAGRMCLQGNMQMKGYYENVSASNLALKEGWLITNDLVYLDSDGFIYMIGRADDIINVGGEKISPFEVENITLQYDKVRECACVGVEDPQNVYGQIPVLYVVFEDGFSEVKYLESFLFEKLERYKIPHKIIHMESLPRNRMKKIDRNQLRKSFAEQNEIKVNNKMDIITAIKTRHSVRDFTDEVIPTKILESIVECGIYAPSGHNMQTWQFTVISNKEKISALKQLTEKVSKEKGTSCYGFNNPVSVVIVTNDRRNETGIQDSSAASQNIMLAAHSFGIGSVWVNVLSRICDEQEVRDYLSELGIPKTHIVISAICLGYPKNQVSVIPRKINVINFF